MDSPAHRWMRRLGAGLLAAVLLAVVGVVANAQPAPASDSKPRPKLEFHISAGDAVATLTEFSRQAQMHVLFDYNVVKGHTARAVSGLYEPTEALRLILADTDLGFDFVNP